MASDFRVGEKVLFGRERGEKTLGEIVKVNRVKVKVRQLEGRGMLRDYPVGTIWTVPASLLSKADDSVSEPVAKPARTEAEILRNIAMIYNGLSPENLHCDGEISRSAAARRGADLRRNLKACFRELGRVVTEEECWRLDK